MTKYYWIAGIFQRSGQNEWEHEETVSDVHPFVYKEQAIDLKDGGKPAFFDYQLINWKEISKEEYDQFKKLFE